MSTGKKIPRDRIARVEELWLASKSDRQIQRIMCDEFEVSMRQVRRYIVLVEAKMAALPGTKPEATRVRVRNMLLETFRRARSRKRTVVVGAGRDATIEIVPDPDLKTMATCSRHLAELDGAIGAKKIEVTGKDGGPIQSAVARVVAMPPMDDPPAAETVHAEPIHPDPTD